MLQSMGLQKVAHNSATEQQAFWDLAQMLSYQDR